jgi:hypothetical protein
MLFGNIKIESTQTHASHKKYTPRVQLKIGYIIHTSSSMDCNGRPIKIFTSGHNASDFAKKAANRWHKTVYVYKVNLNYYSLGTGDNLGTARFGIYSEKIYYSR